METNNYMEKLSVQEFSMLPVQSGLIIETPKGEGEYCGITSSGIVTVLIGGGLLTFSWSECKPKVRLRHLELLDAFQKKVSDYLAFSALEK